MIAEPSARGKGFGLEAISCMLRLVSFQSVMQQIKPLLQAKIQIWIRHSWASMRGDVFRSYKKTEIYADISLSLCPYKKCTKNLENKSHFILQFKHSHISLPSNMMIEGNFWPSPRRSNVICQIFVEPFKDLKFYEIYDMIIHTEKIVLSLQHCAMCIYPSHNFEKNKIHYPFFVGTA